MKILPFMFLKEPAVLILIFTKKRELFCFYAIHFHDTLYSLYSQNFTLSLEIYSQYFCSKKLHFAKCFLVIQSVDLLSPNWLQV